MWRLYADDAKGTCIWYAINHDLIDEKNFFLACINYGNKDCKERHSDSQIP